MNLKEEILLVKETQLPVGICDDIRKTAEDYYIFQRRNNALDKDKKFWCDKIKNKILRHVNYDGVTVVTIIKEDRTIRCKQSPSLKFEYQHQKNLKNKIKYYNSLTGANLICHKNNLGRICTVTGEWDYDNGFTVEVFLDEYKTIINYICSTDVITKYLESEDIKEGNKELIHKYLQTYKKPESLTLPCYEVVEDNVRVIF